MMKKNMVNNKSLDWNDTDTWVKVFYDVMMAYMKSLDAY